MLAALQSSGLVRVGGVATTLEVTQQQWDFPNAWPPCQHLLIVGLANSTAPALRAFAVREPPHGCM